MQVAAAAYKNQNKGFNKASLLPPPQLIGGGLAEKDDEYDGYMRTMETLANYVLSAPRVLIKRVKHGAGGFLIRHH